MSDHNHDDDAFATLDPAALGAVTGGAAAGGDMMPMMMMMMMKGKGKGKSGPPPAPAVAVVPQFTVNGVAQQGTMGADGYNFTSEG